jgi:hypothetical protein
VPPRYTQGAHGAARLVALEDLIADGPVAIAFHRGHWCPYCRQVRQHLGEAHVSLALAVASTISDARHSLQFAVNIWQRFQMPAHGRKGPQQILPWRPTYGAPASSCDIVRRSVSSTEVSVSAGGIQAREGHLQSATHSFARCGTVLRILKRPTRHERSVPRNDIIDFRDLAVCQSATDLPPSRFGPMDKGGTDIVLTFDAYHPKLLITYGQRSGLLYRSLNFGIRDVGGRGRLCGLGSCLVGDNEREHQCKNSLRCEL